MRWRADPRVVPGRKRADRTLVEWGSATALAAEYREIVVLLGQHYKHAEVAEKLQISARTVGRAVQAFGDVLAKMREADE
jgi:DNA-directed RNA polymerase specialized sigma24 family protein